MSRTTIVIGMPYGPDIKRLQEQWPLTSLAEGTVIKHEDLAKALFIPKGSHRYYAVINAWIAKTKNENGIFIVWDQTIGIKVLSPAEILTFAEERTRQKIRQTGRAIRNFAWVDRARLDEVGQQRLDHQVRVANVLKGAMESAKKELAVDLAPIKSLPKPKIIREQSA